jgi:hypothetical protein
LEYSKLQRGLRKISIEKLQAEEYNKPLSFSISKAKGSDSYIGALKAEGGCKIGRRLLQAIHDPSIRESIGEHTLEGNT